jgi:hypothetical protein
MGLPFRKSKVFSRETRHNDRQRKDEQNEAARREVEPRQVEITTPIPEEQRIWLAEQALKEKGINPPVDPHQVCGQPRTDLDFQQACAKGLWEGKDMADALKLENIGKQMVFSMKGCVKGVTEMLLNDYRNETECLDRRLPDYAKYQQQYNTQFAYELSKVPEVNKETVTVKVDDPRHPNFKAPPPPSPWGGNSYNNSNDRDWSFNFNTNGSTHGGGIQWRF